MNPIEIQGQKYEMQFGEVFDLIQGQTKSKNIMIISADQFKIIESIADIEFSADLEKTYIVNKLRFKIVPNFKINPE